MPCKISSSLFSLVTLLLAFSTSLPAANLPVVKVVRLTQENVAQPAVYLGRVEASETIDVMARTEGYVYQRFFRDGENVRAGQRLFEIEAAQQRAELARCQAQLNSASAQLKNARQHLNRLRQLGIGTAVSQSDLDNAVANRDIAQAALKEAEARLQAERLNLDFTQIVAPVSGRIGHSNVHKGTLINPAYGKLATLKKLDPIRVVIAVNERDYLTAQKSLENNLHKANNALTPTLLLANGETYPYSGRFVSLDNFIDSRTGTIAMKLEFANPRQRLLPGGVVTVQLMPQQQNRLMLPTTALQQDADGYFVLKVNKDRLVESSRITLGSQIGQHYVVTSGAEAGDQVIVAGMQRIRPGMQVVIDEAP